MCSAGDRAGGICHRRHDAVRALPTTRDNDNDDDRDRADCPTCPPIVPAITRDGAGFLAHGPRPAALQASLTVFSREAQHAGRWVCFLLNSVRICSPRRRIGASAARPGVVTVKKNAKAGASRYATAPHIVIAGLAGLRRDDEAEDPRCRRCRSRSSWASASLPSARRPGETIKTGWRVESSSRRRRGPRQQPAPRPRRIMRGTFHGSSGRSSPRLVPIRVHATFLLLPSSSHRSSAAGRIALHRGDLFLFNFACVVARAHTSSGDRRRLGVQGARGITLPSATSASFEHADTIPDRTAADRDPAGTAGQRAAAGSRQAFSSATITVGVAGGIERLLMVNVMLAASSLPLR